MRSVKTSTLQMERLPDLLRSGFDTHVEDADNGTVTTVIALLRVFALDASTIAGKYAEAHGRNVVTGNDMRSALMYCARTFFEQEDGTLATRVHEEVVRMNDEEEGEESEESEDDEEYDDSDSEKNEDDEGTGETGGGENGENPRLVQHVNAIVKTWHLWCPEDPVHQLIKRAIDNTTEGG